MDGGHHSRLDRSGWLAVVVCATAILVMLLLSWQAVASKSPTMDEPLHAVGAFVHVFHRDYRINPEDPPLWNHWAMLPHHRDSLKLDFDDPQWKQSLEATDYQSIFCTRTLFQSVNDGVAFIQRSRTAMLLLAAIIALLLGWWSWRIAGAVAAASAVVLFGLDPNFLAHAPLIKNDVAITLLMLALAAATWGVGRKLIWWNILLPGIIIGVGLATKFSGILLIPMLVLMMLTRALLPGNWSCFGRELVRRWQKLLAATGVCVLAAYVSPTIVWAAYGFRFDATPTPGSRLPMQSQVEATANSLYYLAHDGHYPSRQQLAQIQPSLFVRAVLFAESHRLLPQPWLYGLLFTYRTALIRNTFLLGMHSNTGWWYYFPLAMLFKTPLATLASFALALLAWIAYRARRKAPAALLDRIDWWTIACLMIPISVYGLSAMFSNLNLGIRHMLPVYPFLYVLAGIGMVRLREMIPGLFRPMVIVLTLGLAVESFVAFPNYISFFNAASRPFRLKLLSDSNLDWAQDLPALAQWRRRHPTEKLYFGYFGTTDPAVYGIDYLNLPGGFWMGPPFTWPEIRTPGVLAISATLLQGVNTPPSLRYYYAPLRSLRPREVLNDSIYLFDLPLPPGVELKLPTQRQPENAP